MQTSGQQTFIDKEIVYPGDSSINDILFINIALVTAGRDVHFISFLFVIARSSGLKILY